jgi:hypothetical protein
MHTSKLRWIGIQLPEKEVKRRRFERRPFLGKLVEGHSLETSKFCLYFSGSVFGTTYAGTDRSY